MHKWALTCSEPYRDKNTVCIALVHIMYHVLCSMGDVLLSAEAVHYHVQQHQKGAGTLVSLHCQIHLHAQRHRAGIIAATVINISQLDDYIDSNQSLLAFPQHLRTHSITGYHYMFNHIVLKQFAPLLPKYNTSLNFMLNNCETFAYDSHTHLEVAAPCTYIAVLIAVYKSFQCHSDATQHHRE